MISLYLKDGEGLSPTNLSRLGQVHDLIQSLKVPWIVLGDFNMSPGTLDQGGFLDLIGGTVVLADAGAATCTAGKGSLIDFAIVRKDIAESTHLVQDLEAPWSPHVGLMASIHIEAWREKIWKWDHPKHLPTGKSSGPHNQSLAEAAPADEIHWSLKAIEWGAQGGARPKGLPSPAGDGPGPGLPDWDSLPKSEQANSPSLTLRYQTWSSQAERFLLGTWALSPTEFKASQGRGAPPVWTLSERVSPNRQGELLAGDAACHWGALKGRLRQLSGQLLNPNPSLGSQAHQVRLVHNIHRLAAKAVISMGGLPAHTQPQAGAFLADLQDPRWTRATLVARVLSERARRVAESAATHLRQEKQSSFRRWVIESLDQPGAGKAHRYISGKDPPVRATGEGEPEEEDLLWGYQSMDARVGFWNQYWKGQGEAPDWPDWLEELRLEAKRQVAEADRDCISLDQVKTAIQKAPAQAGLGLDSWRPRDWEGLPPDLLGELTQILQEIEAGVVWPSQVLQVLLAFIPKPTGGERPIALTAGLYRLFFRIRKPVVAKWEEAKAGFWDSAIKGSDALRTAISRAVKNEVCIELGKPAVQICWDMEKFYDTIEPGLVAKEGRKLGYPISDLYMGILVHRSGRILRAHGGVSKYVTPRCSILAGCMQSTAWARVVLYDLLQEAHNRFSVSIQSWVDDLTQRSHGMHNGQSQRHQVILVSIGAGALIAQGMSKKGCKISISKSVILATDLELATAVQAGILQEAGIQLPIVQSARDLGIDSGFSKRRRLPTAGARVLKSVAKLKKLRQLARVSTKARRLFRTGVVPQFAWGQEAKGLAPTVIGGFRTRAGQGTGVRKPGGCLTTALATAFEPSNDPAQVLVVSLLQVWCRLWASDPKWHSAISEVWVRTRARLEQKHLGRWNGVSGHIGAVIATLLDLGWSPVSPSTWRDNRGILWALDGDSPSLKKDLQSIIGSTIQEQLWAKASLAYLGKGGEHGIDWLLSLPTLRFLKSKKGDPKAAGALEAAMQGAWWFGSRLLEVGLDQANRWCPWCLDNRKEQVPDDPLHGIWECPCWEQEEVAQAIRSSQGLLAEASAGAASFPIFWFRGLVPSEWTKSILSGWEPPFHTISGGCLEDSTQSNPHPMGPHQIMATDGSGGQYPTNPTLRRVGWGLSIGGQEGQPIGWAREGIGGEQTVPRAELAAVLSGVQQTTGNLTIWSDSAYVVQGASQGWGLRMSNNQDLWGAVRERLTTRPGRVQVLKVKGHATPTDVKEGRATARQAFLNDCADTQAGLGAAQAQLPPNIASAVLEIMSKATQVHKRLAAVSQVLFERKRKEFVKPPRPLIAPRVLPRWEQVFLARAMASEHRVVRHGPRRTRAICTVCSKEGKVRAATRWLLTKCKVQLHEGVDGTRTLSVARTQLWFPH